MISSFAKLIRSLYLSKFQIKKDNKMRQYLFAMIIVCILCVVSIASAETNITSLPYTINTSGSYYLNGNLSSIGDGIIVNADDVTIDFKGHTISGNGTGNGVNTNEFSNIQIKNGTITNFSVGVLNPGTNGKLTSVLNIRAVSNTSHGIYLDDDACVVKNSIASRNGGIGIYVYGLGTIVQGNQVDFNTSGIAGIVVTQATVLDNAVGSNTGNGIQANGSSTIKNNLVFGNSAVGIYVGQQALVDGNTSASNGGGNLFCSGSCVGVNMVQ